MNLWFFVAATVLGLSSVPLMPTVGVRYNTGPPLGRTGGFEEPTCHECHSENPLNDGTGDLTLTGVPAIYTAGSRYQLTVRLSRPGAALGGFQLSGRFAEGVEEGQQAGSFVALDDRVQVDEDSSSALTFARHTKTGTVISDSGGDWTIQWTAPDHVAGPVVFHVAANAANGDELPEGDFIYLQEVRVEGQ